MRKSAGRGMRDEDGIYFDTGVLTGIAVFLAVLVLISGALGYWGLSHSAADMPGKPAGLIAPPSQG